MPADAVAEPLPEGRGSPGLRRHERKRTDIGSQDGKLAFLSDDHFTHMGVVEVVAVAPMARRRQHQRADCMKHYLRQAGIWQQRTMNVIVVQYECPYHYQPAGDRGGQTKRPPGCDCSEDEQRQKDGKSRANVPPTAGGRLFGKGHRCVEQLPARSWRISYCG